jgi:signal transduction histidine kinase
MRWFLWRDTVMSKAKPKTDDLGRNYSAALHHYLRRGGEAALSRAYELGRQGLDEGRGVLSMVALHQEAMARILGTNGGENFLTSRAFDRAGAFFTESMSPYEMTHRAYVEANAVLHRMNQTLEDELKRIAHSIHDGAGQLIAAVHLSLDQVERDLDPGARDRLQMAKRYLDDVYQQLRNLSHELRPTILDDLGLLPAIEFLSEGLAHRTGLRVSAESGPGVRLSAPMETAIYRVIQEALVNIERHASAKSVKIQFRASGKLVRCLVMDDGVGFSPDGARPRTHGAGLGLLGMREKLQPLGGSLKVESAPGEGTKLVISVPRRD